MSDYPGFPTAPDSLNGAAAHLSDEALAALAADAISGDEREYIQRHLASCSDCQHALAQTQRIEALLRATTHETVQSAQAAAESVVASVLARLSATEIPAPSAPGAGAPERPAHAIHAPVARQTHRPQQAQQTWRRNLWRRLGALAAVLLLIASSALLFSRIATHGQTGRPTPTAETPGISNIPGNWKDALPAKSQVSDVAVVSPTDIWVVGTIVSSLAPQALLMHFDGKSWQQSPDQFQFVALTSISMASATDGWAVGYLNNSHPALLHYSNGHWRDALSSLDTSALHSSDLALGNVRMASATSGWMLASLVGIPTEGKATTYVLEYLKVGDTYRWEPVMSWENITLVALSVVSDHEVWVSGNTTTDDLKGVAIRITVTFSNGSSDSPAIRWDSHSWDLGDGYVNELSMRSPTEGWAVGMDSFGAALMFQWNGQSWQPNPFITNVAGAAVGGVVMTSANSGWIYSGSVSDVFLYSLTNGHWFRYLVPQGKAVAALAPISSTAVLAISMTTDQSQAEQGNWDAVPAIYTVGTGTPVAVATATP